MMQIKSIPAFRYQNPSYRAEFYPLSAGVGRRTRTTTRRSQPVSGASDCDGTRLQRQATGSALIAAIANDAQFRPHLPGEANEGNAGRRRDRNLQARRRSRAHDRLHGREGARLRDADAGARYRGRVPRASPHAARSRRGFGRDTDRARSPRADAAAACRSRSRSPLPRSTAAPSRSISRARDSVEAICRGKHQRFIVDVKKTEARLAAKAAKAAA